LQKPSCRSQACHTLSSYLLAFFIFLLGERQQSRDLKSGIKFSDAKSNILLWCVSDYYCSLNCSVFRIKKDNKVILVGDANASVDSVYVWHDSSQSKSAFSKDTIPASSLIDHTWHFWDPPSFNNRRYSTKQ